MRATVPESLPEDGPAAAPSRAPSRSGGPGRRRGSVTALSGATFLPILLGVLTGPLAARALGPAGRGEAAAVGAFALFLPVILSLGMPMAIGQRAATEPAMRIPLVSSAIRFALLTVPLTLVSSAVIMAGPLHAIRGTARVVASVTLATTPLVVLGFSLQQLLLAEGALGTYARLRAIPLLVNAGLTAGLFLAGWLTVATYLAATLAANVTAVALSVRSVGWRPGRAAGAYPLRPLLRFGVRNLFGTLAGLTNARLDQMIMIPFLGSGPLGLYAVSVSVASLPQGIGQAITARSFGEIASSADPSAEAARYLRLTAVVVGGVCASLVAAAPLAVPLVYGDSFRGAVVPLLLLLPGTVALALVFASSNALAVLGRPGLPSWAELGGLLVTVAGLTVLMPVLGIAGAALASTFSYGITLAADVAFLRRVGVRGLGPRGDDVRWILGRMAGAVRRPGTR